MTVLIDERMMGCRDTLVMPILFNGRHALELTLKFTTKLLYEIGAIGARHRTNHDIHSHWCHLRDARVGDTAIRELIVSLEPFVVSLAKIDDDGQQLRYAEDRDGRKSLGGLTVVNLRLIRDSLQEMSTILRDLRDRALYYGYERSTGTHTRECSRTDLRKIAALLGNQSTWRDASFAVKKNKVCKQFGLSGKKFSEAIKKIQGSRELAIILGHESPLIYISDEKAVFAIQQWANVFRNEEEDQGPAVVNLADIDLHEHLRVKHNLNEAIISNLSHEEFSDLETLFCIGRSHEFGERYEEILDRNLKKNTLSMSRWEPVNHIMSKTNLFECVLDGCCIVGRPTLAKKLRAVRG